jgi:hypothetical protein
LQNYSFFLNLPNFVHVFTHKNRGLDENAPLLLN